MNDEFDTYLVVFIIQVFDLVEVRALVCTFGVVSCLVMMYNVFGIILSGGSGKNGSTVAVSIGSF